MSRCALGCQNRIRRCGGRSSAISYLLQRSLFRRLSTGEPVAAWVDQFAYPFRWRYNVLNAAEYLRQASLLDGTRPDPV